MKTLILTLALLSSPLAQAASSVNVIIDGESYSCSKGGSGGGNQCNCTYYQGSSTNWWYEVYKRGSRIQDSSANSKEEAEAACQRWILSHQECYQ
jgi:hypothetical protein